MGDYILVAESQEEQPMELPLEEDGTLLLTTVEAQFPGASGIKFINPQSGAARGVRLAEGKFHSPDKNGWGDQVFFCVFPKGTIIEPRVDNKRKAQVDTQDEAEQPPAKATKLIPKCTDLIVLGLPWETDEVSLKKYFEDNFGPTVMVQVKTNRSGKSRGFGFVRFSDYEIQKNVLKSRHMIDGRWCDVSLPPNAKSGSPKVFVGRLTSAISVKDLNEYFSTLGDVTDCFIPKPFRGFGFVTFLDPEVAKLACKIKDHDIGDVKVHVETAAPKPSQQSGVQERGYKGGRGARNVDYDETWDYGGGREERYGGRSAWSQGGSGGSGSGYGRDVGFNEQRGGIDLRGVSPSRLLSAIKDAGLADAIGGVIRGSGNRGFNSDNGYGRSYSSRSPPPAPPAPSWSRFDR